MTIVAGPPRCLIMVELGISQKSPAAGDILASPDVREDVQIICIIHAKAEQN